NVSVVALVVISSFQHSLSRGTQCQTSRLVSLFPEKVSRRGARYDRNMFDKLPDKPDHPALELEILATWEREGIFEQLRRRNSGGPRWSFVDGPVTANKPLGVHTAWGRTLKDVFQRYKGMR